MLHDNHLSLTVDYLLLYKLLHDNHLCSCMLDQALSSPKHLALLRVLGHHSWFIYFDKLIGISLIYYNKVLIIVIYWLSTLNTVSTHFAEFYS